jgi:GNAT superfamily N-acetyltransferase
MTAHSMASDPGRAQEASVSTSGGPEVRSWLIRPAEPGDEDQLLALIQALAEYEREPDAVRTTPSDLAVALFPAQGEPLAHAFVAEWQEPDADPAVFGLAIWFVTFSTWTGRHGIWLEDLFVAPSGRGCGAGKALLAELAAECHRRGYARLDWAVLDWNAPAQDFYRSLGARPMDEWTSWRLDDEALLTLGTLEQTTRETGLPE